MDKHKISLALSESAGLISENRAKQADQKAFSDLRERARRYLHHEAIRFQVSIAMF